MFVLLRVGRELLFLTKDIVLFKKKKKVNFGVKELSLSFYNEQMVISSFAF